MRRLAGESGRIARHVARALKLDDEATWSCTPVAPRARGLKHSGRRYRGAQHQSRPTWARGLKQNPASGVPEEAPVAPHVGPWIETLALTSTSIQVRLSRPTWARGLKRKLEEQEASAQAVAPRVRVD
jgi:hypothetical protein